MEQVPVVLQGAAGVPAPEEIDMVDQRNPCCRQCALEAHAEAGEVAPQVLVDAHAAAQASPVGRWIAEHTQAFLEGHLADVEPVR